MDSQNKPTLVLLDVYGTLMQMDDVEAKVNTLLKSSKGYQVWFQLFMQYCFVDNCIRQFDDFRSIAKATLFMAAELLERQVRDDEAAAIIDLFTQLPVYPQVQKGLSSLADQGFRIAALTNSSENIVCERMERTGLISYFEAVLSAEKVGKYKPSIEVYEWAASHMKVNPSDVLMVSTHGWDLAGASNAGMRTAYLKRTNEALYPLAPKPEFTCKNLLELAMELSGQEEVL